MPSGRLSSRSAKLLPSKEFVVGKQFPLLLLLLLVMMLQLLFGVEIADCKNDPDDGAVTALAGRSPRDALLPTLEGCLGETKTKHLKQKIRPRNVKTMQL